MLVEFHIKFQCQILHMHWSQHVKSAEISTRTSLPPAMVFIRRCRLSVLGHIAWLTQGSPAHNALHCQVILATCCSLNGNWRHCPGLFVFAGQTISTMTLDLSLPSSGDRPFYGAMVERCNSSSWLRDDDEESDDLQHWTAAFHRLKKTSPAVDRKADHTAYDVQYSYRTLLEIAMGNLVTVAIPDQQILAV